MQLNLTDNSIVILKRFKELYAFAISFVQNVFSHKKETKLVIEMDWSMRLLIRLIRHSETIHRLIQIYQKIRVEQKQHTLVQRIDSPLISRSASLIGRTELFTSGGSGQFFENPSCAESGSVFRGFVSSLGRDRQLPTIDRFSAGPAFLEH